MTVTNFDPLDAFAHWFLSAAQTYPREREMSVIEGVVSILWYRNGQFQVQQFIAPPDKIIPEHVHPNVDSYEIFIGGEIAFSKNKLHQNTHIIRVNHNDWHGGVMGPLGGSFFSIQHWLNGVKPHCVAADYTGGVMGPDHLQKVKAGNPFLREVITRQDSGLPDA